jgi:hypothetical protein
MTSLAPTLSLKRNRLAGDVLVHGSIGSDVVKCFGIVEPESAAGVAIFGVERHLRELVNGVAISDGYRVPATLTNYPHPQSDASSCPQNKFRR